MLEFLIVQAPACAIVVERRESAVMLRPTCPTDYLHTRDAVAALLAGEPGNDLRISFGRIERYAWLSTLLARQASSSRHWDATAGRDNQYVAAALRGMPEFISLFGRWHIVGVSVEKVLVKPAAELSLPAGAPVPAHAKLPYDAILWVTLKKQ